MSESEKEIIIKIKSDFMSESEIEDIEKKRDLDYVKKQIKIITRIIIYVPFIIIGIIVIELIIRTMWSWLL